MDSDRPTMSAPVCLKEACPHALAPEPAGRLPSTLLGLCPRHFGKTLGASWSDKLETLHPGPPWEPRLPLVFHGSPGPMKSGLRSLALRALSLSLVPPFCPETALSPAVCVFKSCCIWFVLPRGA